MAGKLSLHACGDLAFSSSIDFFPYGSLVWKSHIYVFKFQSLAFCSSQYCGSGRPYSLAFVDHRHSAGRIIAQKGLRRHDPHVTIDRLTTFVGLSAVCMVFALS